MSNGLTKWGRKPVAVVPGAPAVPVKKLEISSIIGYGMEMNGDAELTSGLRIDGVARGKIEKKRGCENGEITVHIARGGLFEGEIVADHVIIEGDVHGSVTAIKNLVVRGLIRGKASYGESVELTGIIEADISRMGHTEYRDITDAHGPAGPATPPSAPAVPAAPLATAAAPTVATAAAAAAAQAGPFSGGNFRPIKRPARTPLRGTDMPGPAAPAQALRA